MTVNRVFRNLLITMMPTILFGCDANNQESYKSKIDRFEQNYALTQADKGIEQAINLAAEENIKNVEIPTHESLPIPVIYKKNYEELGFDTSRMVFSTPDWYINQQEYKTATANTQSQENSELIAHEH